MCWCGNKPDVLQHFHICPLLICPLLSLTQFGENNARSSPLTHWPEDLRQDRVGADGYSAGLSEARVNGVV